ncbi:hypothetical protein ON010_g10842 [Phytophthora cinnamomi]|nr:hypothetical protein ON010_g10842 [Phytophthora cinnamomi]
MATIITSFQIASHTTPRFSTHTSPGHHEQVVAPAGGLAHACRVESRYHTAVPAATSESKLSKLTKLHVQGLDRTGQTAVRSLRGIKSTDNAADEERGGAGFIQKLETALSKTSIGQILKAREQVKLAEREALVKNFVSSGACFKTFYANKVTYNEMDKALGISNLKLPNQNAAVLVPEYGTLSRYSRFIQKEEKLKAILKRRG